jgi:hypothetical protein
MTPLQRFFMSASRSLRAGSHAEHPRMPNFTRRTLLAAAVVFAALPAAAATAREPQPLVDMPPATTRFTDRVLTGSQRLPHATAASDGTAAYAAPDGQTVQVMFSPGYTPNPEIAQTYVNFLGGLPHGSELSKLSIFIATPDEVKQLCGGQEGTLACYSSATHTMTVPGEPLDQGPGVTTSYVIAHEYGHHVAAFRSNAPFAALDYGPKYWASYERVCLRTLEGRLAPGDEGQHYLANPGEAWADTFAHLTYPDAPWQFTQLLRPDAGAYAAARQDVLTPWTAPRTRTFTGTFTPRTKNTRLYAFTLHLDGTMTLALRGPKGTQYDLAVSSHGKVQDRTSTPGSHDRISYPRGACRETPTETVGLTVSRRHGSGPFTLRLTYAG